MTNIAYWDGSAWHAMGNPFNGFVNALQFYGGYLYAGGTFTNRTLLFTNIARWNGSTWSAVPGGSANRAVYDFATDGTNLYVGGLFTQIGGIPGINIVRFTARPGRRWRRIALFPERVGGGRHCSGTPINYTSQVVSTARAQRRCGQRRALGRHEVVESRRRYQQRHVAFA